MAEMLGLGMTHFPPLSARDERMKSAFLHMLRHPANERRRQDPAGWPELLRAEWSDDEGLAAAAAHRERLVTGLRRVRQELDEFGPDVVVVWGDDQYENFRESIIPPFCVLAYPEFTFRPWKKFHLGVNLWEEPDDVEFRVDGCQRAAKELVNGLLQQGFDISYSYEPNEFDGLSHAFANTVLYLDYDRAGFEYPVVPMSINCYGGLVNSARGLFVDPGNPPSGDTLDPIAPLPWRCFDLGSAVARTLADSPWRVALIASASWSHGFLTPGNDYLYPALEADERMFAALQTSDWSTWREYPASAVQENGQQEMLNWMCLAGAAQELAWSARWADFVPTQLFNSNKAFTILR